MNTKDKFDKKFGKLFTIKQLENTKKKGGNWKSYPLNEEIKQFYNSEISKLLKEQTKKIEDAREETRKETGSFKYDFAYDGIIKLINK